MDATEGADATTPEGEQQQDEHNEAVALTDDGNAEVHAQADEQAQEEESGKGEAADGVEAADGADGVDGVDGVDQAKEEQGESQVGEGGEEVSAAEEEIQGGEEANDADDVAQESTQHGEEEVHESASDESAPDNAAEGDGNNGSDPAAPQPRELSDEEEARVAAIRSEIASLEEQRAQIADEAAAARKEMAEKQQPTEEPVDGALEEQARHDSVTATLPVDEIATAKAEEEEREEARNGDGEDAHATGEGIGQEEKQKEGDEETAEAAEPEESEKRADPSPDDGSSSSSNDPANEPLPAVLVQDTELIASLNALRSELHALTGEVVALLDTGTGESLAPSHEDAASNDEGTPQVATEEGSPEASSLEGGEDRQSLEGGDEGGASDLTEYDRMSAQLSQMKAAFELLKEERARANSVEEAEDLDRKIEAAAAELADFEAAIPEKGLSPAEMEALEEQQRLEREAHELADAEERERARIEKLAVAREKRELLESLEALEREHSSYKNTNTLLQTNILEILRKRTKEQQPLMREAEALLRYNALMDDLEALEIDEDNAKRFFAEELARLQDLLVAREQEVQAVILEYKKQRRQIASKTVSGRSAMRLRPEQFKRMDEAYEAKEGELAVERRKHYRIQASVSHVEDEMYHRDQMAGGLHLIDFEQLKIENQAFNEKIEERSEELIRLKRRITNTVQVLTHVKEKLSATEAKNLRLKEELKTVDAKLARDREALTHSKKSKEKVHKQTQDLQKQTMLLSNKELLRTYERQQDQTTNLHATLSSLTDRRQNAINETMRLTRRRQQQQPMYHHQQQQLRSAGSFSRGRSNLTSANMSVLDEEEPPLTAASNSSAFNF